MNDLRVPASGVRALRELACGRMTVSQLAARLGRSRPATSLVLRTLVERSFVSLERRGMAKLVGLTEAKHALVLRDLMLARPHVPWERLLAGPSVPILLDIVEGGSAQSGAQLSRSTLARHIARLKAHGLVVERGGALRLGDGDARLAEFLAEYRAWSLRRAAVALSPAAVVLWRRGRSCLVRVPAGAPVDLAAGGFHPTALSELPRHGIQLISVFDYYIHSPVPPTLEEVVLHTLLVEPGSVRYVGFALLLMTAERPRLDRGLLLRGAEAIGVKGQVEAMLAFLDGGRARPGAVLPSMGEFNELKEEYRLG